MGANSARSQVIILGEAAQPPVDVPPEVAILLAVLNDLPVGVFDGRVRVLEGPVQVGRVASGSGIKTREVLHDVPVAPPAGEVAHEAPIP